MIVELTKTIDYAQPCLWNPLKLEHGQLFPGPCDADYLKRILGESRYTLLVRDGAVVEPG